MTAILSTLAVFPSIDALNLRLSRGIGLTIIQGEGKGSNKGNNFKIIIQHKLILFDSIWN